MAKSASFQTASERRDINTACFDSRLLSLPLSCSVLAHRPTLVANVMQQDVSLAGYVLVLSQAHERIHLT